MSVHLIAVHGSLGDAFCAVSVIARMCGRDTGHLFKSHGALGVWCARGKSTVGGLVILSTLRDRDWLTNILVNDHSAVRRSDTCPTEITARRIRISQARREKVQCDKEMARMWEERRVFSVEGVIFLIFYLIRSAACQTVHA